MLNISYYIDIKKTNSKFLQTNPILLFTIFKLVVDDKKINILCNKKKQTVKTLMMSPFHYKVAKRNITNRRTHVHITISDIKSKNSNVLTLYKHYNNLLTGVNLI